MRLLSDPVSLVSSGTLSTMSFTNSTPRDLGPELRTGTTGSRCTDTGSMNSVIIMDDVTQPLRT